jgi:hypothetical protein
MRKHSTMTGSGQTAAKLDRNLALELERETAEAASRLTSSSAV